MIDYVIEPVFYVKAKVERVGKLHGLGIGYTAVYDLGTAESIEEAEAIVKQYQNGKLKMKGVSL